MGADVGKVVDADPEPTRHFPKRAAHGALVPAKRPGPARPLARKNDVHRASRADGALELAPAPSDSAAMGRSDELSVDVATEEGLLHERSLADNLTWGNVVLRIFEPESDDFRLPNT